MQQAGGVRKLWYHFLAIELSNQKQIKMKYTVALDGRVQINFTQQPTKNSSTVEIGAVTIGEREGMQINQQ